MSEFLIIRNRSSGARLLKQASHYPLASVPVLPEHILESTPTPTRAFGSRRALLPPPCAEAHKRLVFLQRETKR